MRLRIVAVGMMRNLSLDAVGGAVGEWKVRYLLLMVVGLRICNQLEFRGVNF